MPGDRSALACAGHDRRLRPVRAFALARFALIAACAPRAACDMQAAHDDRVHQARSARTVVVRTLGARCDRAIAVCRVDGRGRRAAVVLERAAGASLWRCFRRQRSRSDGQISSTRWARPDAVAHRSSAGMVLAGARADHARPPHLRRSARPQSADAVPFFRIGARETCVFWEPAAGFAAHFYDRDALTAPERKLGGKRRLAAVPRGAYSPVQPWTLHGTQTRLS